MEIKIIITKEDGTIKENILSRPLLDYIWDAFLEAEMKDEHWHDQDTADLIQKKITGESPIEHYL